MIIYVSTDKYSLKADFGLKYDHKDIGAYLRTLRLAKGWSMYQLAYKSCVRESVIMRIEKGLRDPRLSTLLKIIDGLGISLAEFCQDFTKH
ncbi:MAG: helix-turn-helix transcriptional regulator [Candidatus Margulisbacteria bacterium]|jgi:transcriptional regulator with XRE-family HTH domain|nr:helix-turn-helix transcriptional regulator [Candidatus Margulisiibacteriota bacterium]